MKMKNNRKKYYQLVLFIILALGCKESYEPAAITIDRNYLVVDGFINSNRDSLTTITLSRTRPLTDSTFTSDPELRARVVIQGEGGDSYTLQERANGVYTASLMNINQSSRYRLRVSTVANKEYLSEYVPVQQSPAIDSVTWEQHDDVTIYVNTHDPFNNTRYYRWDYLETWEHHSAYDSPWGVSNGYIFIVDVATQGFMCWSTVPSTEIVLGTSIQLGQDVISHQPVGMVAQHSVKIGVRYSMLLKQYALTERAFDYWQILKKNTQELGTLFDPQPSQLRGNIHCITNPAEPVIGYVSVGSVSSKRIFIDKNDVSNWNPPVTPFCDVKEIPKGFPDPLVYTYPDPTYAPYYFVTGGGLFIAKKECVDCRLQGGVNQKPIFWQ